MKRVLKLGSKSFSRKTTHTLPSRSSKSHIEELFKSFHLKIFSKLIDKKEKQFQMKPNLPKILSDFESIVKSEKSESELDLEIINYLKDQQSGKRKFTIFYNFLRNSFFLTKFRHKFGRKKTKNRHYWRNRFLHSINNKPNGRFNKLEIYS